MILVTGGAGFLGRRIVAALSERGKPVRVLLRRKEQARVVERYAPEIAFADTRDADALNRAFEGVQQLIHLVAIIRERRGATYRAVNVEGARNVYSAAAIAGVRRSVFTSVIGAAPRSADPYYASRWDGEEAARASGVATTVLRFAPLFGEGDEFFNVIAALVRLAPIVPIAGPGRSKFQPFDVRDAAEACVRALDDQSLAGRTIEAGGPHVHTYREMVDIVAGTMDKRRLKVSVPMMLMKPTVAAMSLVMKSPPVTPGMLRSLSIDNAAKPGVVEREFRFKPRSLHGNIDYVRNVTYRDALRIMLGSMPRHIRDH
ncbi:MAG: NAD-dependent epimerase/dehydratase family protein [Chloroflexi bacterium]|nr:NAD-dependent epimerase/dehydratase family protein [Chloroflexota bacterium]